MKKKFLLICLMFLPMLAFSQVKNYDSPLRFSVKGGLNLSGLSGDVDFGSKVGFRIGGVANYYWGNKAFFEPSLFIATKGAKEGAVTINEVYLEMPLNVGKAFRVNDDLDFYFKAGPYLAYGIGGSSDVEDGTTTISIDTFGDDGLKRFDFGLGAGIGFDYNNILFGLDGNFGLTDISNGDDSAKNYCFSISVGYQF